VVTRSKNFRSGLAKTRRSFFAKIAGLFRGNQITDETWEELEMLLIQADMGVDTTLELIETMREEVTRRGLKDSAQMESLLKDHLVALLEQVSRPYLPDERMLHVVLVVGVNGSGKTTTIAKLAKFHRDRGEKVLLAAADTFRAAAIDQLKVWGQRVGVDVVAHQPGADPGAVVFDAIRASQSRGVQVLLIDTAGRLHTKHNLMQELRKIKGVAQKQVHQAPHETVLVLDATTGQNALVQARKFSEEVGVTGIVLAKLDSTAKGGMVFAIAQELKLPIFFVTVGEGLDQLVVFDPQAFVEGLFEENSRRLR